VAATALDILRLCAASPWLGDYAIRFGAATGGSLSTLVDSDLITYAGDQRWKNHHLTIWTGGPRHRYAYSVGGGSGTLEWVGPTAAGAIASGDEYVILRDAPYSRWLDWMNETAKSIHYSREVYLRGVTSQLRYTLPTPLSYGGWVEAVMIGPFPFSFQEQYPRRVQWHRLNPANIEGDLHLVLNAAIGPGEQILFLARPPYLHAELSAYTMSRSVLSPLGGGGPANPPARLIAAGTVWRCLRQKVQNLTGEARLLWADNLNQAARAYAQACAEHGVKAVAAETLGYSESW
jgi:hypothetical protein